MALLSQFTTPAGVQDFSSNPQLQELMNAAWSANVNRWVDASLIGDVWDLVNYGPRPAFYNPTVTDTPSTAQNVPIPWNAFPGRIQALFPDKSQYWYQWADQGVPAQDPVTTDLCTNKPISPIPYPPTGPRGWQDEYCEWSVTRDATGNITSVMFTCENPEYWFTLWEVNPAKVLQLYQQLVGPAVQMQDLCLKDGSGNVVVDPATGQPAYNPLNKWNSGTVSSAQSGGAVHLTSSPNTLGAEYDLAAAGTMPRSKDGEPVTSASALVCFAKYGKIGRHSDPTIGQSVNQLINYTQALPKARATLTNPPGLYMQTPDFTGFKTPDGTPAKQFWTVVRGTLADPNIPDDIDRILHATFSVPADKNYTVSDISINGANIAYASQITEQIGMALMATAFANGGVQQTPVGATAPKADPSPAVSALQSYNVFAAYRNQEAASNELPLSIPILAYALAPGQSVENVALLLNTSDTPNGASFTVPEGGVTIQVTGTASLPAAQMNVYLVTITASATAKPGDRSVLAAVQGMPATSQAALGLLTIAAPTASTQQVSGARPAFRKGRT
jgi:hypothetical protein